MNRGNTGQRGYRMSKVTAIGAQGTMVVITLDCGHTNVFEPYHGYSAEEWAAHLQRGERPFVVGQTRLRCDRKHTEGTTP